LNIPNLLSILRIVLIPLFLYLLFVPTISFRIWALAVFAIASFTDLLDGWSARKLKQVTVTGKFLDPLADKFLVVSAVIAFTILDPLVPLWMLLVIIGRDIMITMMRYLAIKKGAGLRTSSFGKIKTAFQMISIIVILMVYVFWSSGVNLSHGFPISSFMKLNTVYQILMSDHPNKILIVGPYCLMAVVTLLTALSGIRYLFTNWRLFVPPYTVNKD
jgi:cardiolipin synthase (CMP-forming)